MSPEAELLLLCARSRDAHARERIEARLAAGVDFTAFLELAARHRLKPLVLRRFEALKVTGIPPAVVTALWSWSVRVAAHARVLSAELLRVLAAFDAAGVAALPYKGPVLAQSLFDDVAMREYADLDILVRPRDLARAQALLVAHGYEADPTEVSRLLSSPAEYHAQCVHPESGTCIELHWKTDPKFPVEEAFDLPWWTRAAMQPFEGAMVRAFTPGELLLVLSLHGSKHHWSSLAWLVDVAALLHGLAEADLAHQVEVSRRFGCERRFALGLWLAQALLDAPLPASTRAWVESHSATVAHVGAIVMQHALAARPSDVSAFQRLALDLRLFDRTRDRFSHAMGTLLRPTAADEHEARGVRPLAAALRIGRLLRARAS